jgi:hypothetical protein
MRIQLALLLSIAAACSAAPPRPTLPAGAVVRTGDVHDFEYFDGAWTTQQRRLKARGVGSSDWDEFPATLCTTLYLGGMVTVGELYFPTKGWSGVTVRAFDLEHRRWSVHWVSGKVGRLGGAPVTGGFAGDRGEFYGDDDDDGRAVVVRTMWHKRDRDHARWEQAFSYDGRTWETNWTAEFVRADPAATCEAGRPKQQVGSLTSGR